MMEKNIENHKTEVSPTSGLVAILATIQVIAGVVGLTQLWLWDKKLGFGILGLVAVIDLVTNRRQMKRFKIRLIHWMKGAAPQ